MQDTTSTLDSLPQEVREYASLHQQCQVLNAELTQRRQRMKELQNHIMPMMEEHGVDCYDIQPTTPEEEAVVGKTGRLERKTKNDYERLTEGRLGFYCVQWAKLMLGPNAESADSLGLSLASYLWQQRKKTRVQYLERLDRKKRRHRTEADPMADEGTSRKRASVGPLGISIASSRDQFLAIPGMRDLLSHSSCDL